MSITVGQTIPSGELHEGTPGTKHDPAALFATGKHVLFAVPGAFTPGCSKTHLPGYIEAADRLKAKGISTINCLGVNDAFVMGAWGDALAAAGKVRMLADPAGAFTKTLGLEVHAAALGGLRSKRYAMVIEDGKVTELQVEPDGFGMSCSLAPALLDRL